MTHFSRKIALSLFLLCAVLIAFWQISFLVYPLKWDVIDVVLPFRYYFSECIQSGYFPFWNPYQQTGTPFYADLQVPFFYPELLYTSIFFGYGVYIMNFFFVAYIFIAAAGMYHLSFYFNQNRIASAIAALAYSLSGYVIGHGQHFFLLVGAAWIPFVLVSYIQLNEKKDFVHILKAAFFIFLMITGAYQALSFTLFYLLVFLFLYAVIKSVFQKNFSELFDILKVNLILLLLVVLLALPLIIAALEIITSVERLGSGIGLTQTLDYGQSLKSMISFLVPFSTLKNSAFFGEVDISMRNHYFGLIPLLFFTAALFQKRKIVEYIFLLFGLIIFASAFSFLPVREFLYNQVPFMNLFKYAAFIRIFGLLAFIMVMANYIAYLQNNFEKEKKKLIVITGLFVLFILVLILYSLAKIPKEDFRIFSNLKHFIAISESMSFYQHVLVQAIFQLFILGVFLLFVIFKKSFRFTFYALIILIAADLILSVQLNLPVTVADSKHKPFRMKKDLSLFSDKFPLPTDSKIKYNNRKHAAFSPFWRNTYIFSKQVSFQSFSSFELDSYSKLDDEHIDLQETVLNNHLFYFSDTILTLEQLPDTFNSQVNSRFLYLSDNDFNELSGRAVSTSSSDQTQILEFSPTEISVETITKNDQYLTLLQTNYPGWKATIDGENVPVYTSNFNFRTIFLPKGKHTIRYKYSNQKILVLYVFSNLLFLFIVVYLLVNIMKNFGCKRNVTVFIPLLIILVIAFFLIKRLSYNDHNLSVYKQYDKRWADNNSIYHSTSDFEDLNYKIDSSIAFSGKNSLQINPVDEYFTLDNIPVGSKKWKNGTLVVSAMIFPESYVEGLIVSEVSKSKSENNWHASKIERHIEKLSKWNRVVYVRNFYNLQEGEEIKVFLWNLNQMSFKLDNVTINFYPF